MTDIISPTSPRPAGNPRLRNPVVVKELRSRMRGRRAFVVLSIYLLLMSGLIALIYAGYASQVNRPFGPDSRQAGKAVFAAVLTIQVFLVVFMGPAFTAGAISGEKERQTYDLLRTTLLSPRALVLGKLVSALSYVLLLVFAAVPLQSIAFFLGGIDWIELLVSQLLVVVSAITFALVGLYASARMRTTLSASVVAYAGALFLLGGLPIVAMFSIPFFGIFFNTGSPPAWLEPLMLYGGTFLAATNLPATLIMSEVLLVQESAIFYFSTTTGGYTVYLPSPWWPYLIMYSLLALLLYAGCVRRVRRIATR